MLQSLRDLKTLVYLSPRQRRGRTVLPSSQRSVLSKEFPLTRDAWHPQRIELYSSTGRGYIPFHRLLRLLGWKTERSCTWPLRVPLNLPHPAGFNICLHDGRRSTEMDAALIQAHM